MRSSTRFRLWTARSVPNDALDHAGPIGEPLPGADDVAEGPDGSLYVSAGRKVLRLSGPGYATRAVVAEFEADAAGLTFHPDGRLCLRRRRAGLAAVDGAGRQTGSARRRTAAALPDQRRGGARRHYLRQRRQPRHRGGGMVRRPDGEESRSDRIIACGPALESARVLLRDLHYPHGLAIARRAISGSPKAGAIVSAARPFGPRRIGASRPSSATCRAIRRGSAGPRAAASGSVVFALRTHLIEFVLREDDFRDEMMRTIAPRILDRAGAGDHAATASSRCRAARIKALGIQKPWAPPRSYGLLARHRRRRRRRREPAQPGRRPLPRHHRCLETAQGLVDRLQRQRPRAARRVGGATMNEIDRCGRDSVVAASRSREPVLRVIERQQDLRRRARHRGHRFRSLPRRGACAGRRERRRQVDALQGDRRRDPARPRATYSSTASRSISSRPRDALAAGICMVYQETSLVPTMTAAQNIELGNEKLLTRFRTLNIQAQQLLQSLNFHVDPATPVALLGTAKRQMVEIARAVYNKARIIIFDEPTASLTPEEIVHFFHLVRDLRARGVAIIYISHALEESLQISDRITVLRDGKLVITAKTSEMTREKLVRDMVGRDIAQTHYARQREAGRRRRQRRTRRC